MTNKTKCYSIIFTFVVVAILTSILPNVYASESNSKRYNDGYNEGYGWYANHPNDGPNNCDPNSLYTTGGGHTSTYCNGWADGYNAASGNGGSNNIPQQQPQQQPQQGSINWEDLCNRYGGLVGIHTPCDQLAHGSQLTQEGRTGLVCLLTGGLGLLSGLINAQDAAAVKAAGQGVCP